MSPITRENLLCPGSHFSAVLEYIKCLPPTVSTAAYFLNSLGILPLPNLVIAAVSLSQFGFRHPPHHIDNHPHVVADVVVVVYSSSARILLSKWSSIAITVRLPLSVSTIGIEALAISIPVTLRIFLYLSSSV